MRRREIITLVVLVLCFTMFTTESLHHIPAAAVCLFALTLLVFTHIIESGEIRTAVNWDLVIFIGTAMSFGTMFDAGGVTVWLSDSLVGAVKPIAGSPWIFVPVITCVLFLWRFVDIPCFIPTFAIVAAILPELAREYGINPLIFPSILCIASNSFFMSYTNIFALTAESSLEKHGWTSNHLFRYSAVYFAASLIACTAAVAYWQNMGMI